MTVVFFNCEYNTNAHNNLWTQLRSIVILFQDLYHEAYTNVCVMFASIANFWDFYQQTTVTKHGIECLKVLNEIIGDLDQVGSDDWLKCLFSVANWILVHSEAL